MRETFDDPLFIRVPSGVAPTPRAHAIIQAVRPVVARLQDDLLTGQMFDPATSTRPFTLALSDVGERAFLPRVFRQLRSGAPHCIPRVTIEWFRDQLVELFREDRRLTTPPRGD